MADVIHHVFSWVCGQAADRTWSPGGVPLPFCQRCTGLYAGVPLALLAQALVRLRSTYALRWIYGLCLIQMIPFGYHWIEGGPILRTLSGAVFAFGLVGFLAAPFLAAWRKPAAPPRLGALLLLGAAGPAVVVAAARGGAAARATLTALGTLGLGALVLLLAANLALVARRLRPRVPRGAP
jgi:uncharacterized membrane protein